MGIIRRRYWKEVKDERGRGTNVSIEGNEVKDEDGRMLREKVAVKRIWTECFENYIDMKSDGEAIGMCMEVIGDGGRVHGHKEERK